MKKQSNSYRQSRTRTLIQLGGLMDRVNGLLTSFDITLGEDLQHPENLSKAAALVGFIKEKYEEEELTNQKKHSWTVIGGSILRTTLKLT